MLCESDNELTCWQAVAFSNFKHALVTEILHETMLHYLLQMLQQYWSDSSGPNTQELKKNCANSSGCNTSSDKKEFAIVLTPSPNSVIPCHAKLWKVGARTELILIQKLFPKHQHFSLWHVAPSVCASLKAHDGFLNSREPDTCSWKLQPKKQCATSEPRFAI